MSSPALHVEGPYDSSGSETGPDLDLYLGQEATDEAETETNTQSVPTQEDSESILAPLQGKREIRYDGIANGLRLQQAGFDTSSAEALVKWLIHFESLVSAEMGQGYKVTDDTRNETLDPTVGEPGILFNSVSWSYTAGEGINAEWSLEGKVSEGMQNSFDRQTYITREINSRQTITNDRIEAQNSSLTFDLGELSERRYERSVDLNVMDMVHQTDVPVVGITQTGVQGNLMLEGRLSRNDADLKQAAREINDDFHGLQVDFYDAFTERVFSGAITDTNTVFSAGTPDILEYRVEIQVGTSARDV